MGAFFAVRSLSLSFFLQSVAFLLPVSDDNYQQQLKTETPSALLKFIQVSLPRTWVWWLWEFQLTFDQWHIISLGLAEDFRVIASQEAQCVVNELSIFPSTVTIWISLMAAIYVGGAGWKDRLVWDLKHKVKDLGLTLGLLMQGTQSTELACKNMLSP